MQRFICVSDGMDMVEDKDGDFYAVADVAAHVDELNAEIESLKVQLSAANQRATLWTDRCTVAKEERDIAHRALAERDAGFEPANLPQPPNILPEPPSHETSYANNLTQALRERDTLRDVLALLAPDLKAMAILYAQQGDHTRSQVLANICKSVGVL